MAIGRSGRSWRTARRPRDPAMTSPRSDQLLCVTTPAASTSNVHRPQQPQRQRLAGPKYGTISLAGNPRPGGCLLFCSAVLCAACASTTGFHTALGLLPTQHSGSLTSLRRCLVSSRSYLLSGADSLETRLVPEVNIITQNGCLGWLYTKSRGVGGHGIAVQPWFCL